MSLKQKPDTLGCSCIAGYSEVAGESGKARECVIYMFRECVIYMHDAVVLPAKYLVRRQNALEHLIRIFRFLAIDTTR